MLYNIDDTSWSMLAKDTLLPQCCQLEAESYSKLTCQTPRALIAWMESKYTAEKISESSIKLIFVKT